MATEEDEVGAKVWTIMYRLRGFRTAYFLGRGDASQQQGGFYLMKGIVESKLPECFLLAFDGKADGGMRGGYYFGELKFTH